nr:uncharacterized protein LOC119174960 [Rhipicephalus microplus]
MQGPTGSTQGRHHFKCTAPGCQARNDNEVPMPVGFPASLPKRSVNEMVLEQSITAERRTRTPASGTHFKYAERVERCQKYHHDSSDDQIRSVESLRKRAAVETRRTSDEDWLGFARMRNARHVRENINYERSQRSASVHSCLKMSTNETISVTTRSTQNSREAGDIYQNSPEYARSSRTRTERYSFEQRQINKRDTHHAVSNSRHDATTTRNLLKTAPHSPRRMFQTVHQADFSEWEELKYREKHQESPLFWNELASSYFRTSGNLLETVLTVGVVAWMTMSPKRKLIN